MEADKDVYRKNKVKIGEKNETWGYGELEKQGAVG